MEKNPPRLPGYQLPTGPHLSRGREAYGFLTPIQDLMPQVFSIPPRRVLPIIFLPGIMGSNLRTSAARQAALDRGNNIAWCPESKTTSIALAKASARQRQNQLDYAQTEVDMYEPGRDSTGDAKESSDERQAAVKVGFRYPVDVSIDMPLLMDDPKSMPLAKTKEQKARARGWGEIFFGSYCDLLEMCELRLNTAFHRGKMDTWWRVVIGVAPETWQASLQPRLLPLDETALKKAVENCWFPVHAMGYNWLQSNRKSGIVIAHRINALMEKYRTQGFQCEKVIVVTHSMGGMVGRALIHPEMGNLGEKVLGIVHGVMPALGAAAAYKRIRTGFEDPGVVSMSPIVSVTAKVLGNYGREVTAVLANAPGGLELLPSQAYGNGWLQIRQNGQTLRSLPEQGDPYEEIYKLRGKWYGLLREEWINPARQPQSGFDRTAKMLDEAKMFHKEIGATYHGQSYAHYGADSARAAWHNVVWNLGSKSDISGMDQFQIRTDDEQGNLTLCKPGSAVHVANTDDVPAALLPAGEPGDQTVPLHSSEHQYHSGKFKGIFRQTGYEHQASYKDEGALYSTLYSLVCIAQTMKWTK
ncbi:MAG: hypothetical protein V4693_19160 [Pseudomonadota bacterium]